MLSFPTGFLWGAATSGYQIEGHTDADGKGCSVWDAFAHQPGRILHGDTGDIACNAYDPRQLESDLDLMAALGLTAYIFSVQWPRIQADGHGPANQKGLDYYRRLVDGLNRRGIVPVLTIYHWELPQALEDLGGWRARDTVERFVDYAVILHRTFADQVPFWVTQNEPNNSAWLGYGVGKHAPGLSGAVNALTVAHHLLLSHGRVLQAFAGSDRPNRPRFGPVLSVAPMHPANPDSPADRAAAWRMDGEQNRLFLDPIFRGEYPADIQEAFREQTDFAFVQPGDLETIHAPVDFLGVNYYTGPTVAALPGGGIAWPPARGPVTAMGWAILPEGLRETLTRLRTDYTGHLPLFISENGASFRDYLDPEGKCHDPERIDFLRAHIEQAHRAITDGVPLKGYFVWSLLDNFEWDSGYRERFGLTYVDYATQRRVPKDSFAWYRQVIARNGLD